MKFQVEDRFSITQINPKVLHVIISVSDPEADHAEPARNAFTQDILFLKFHDTNFEHDGMTPITAEQAQTILSFYTKYKDAVELVIAHCNAGQCRSPAILAALQTVATGNSGDWFKTRTPNSRVYSTVLGEAVEAGLYDPFAGRF